MGGGYTPRPLLAFFFIPSLWRQPSIWEPWALNRERGSGGGAPVRTRTSTPCSPWSTRPPLNRYCGPGAEGGRSIQLVDRAHFFPWGWHGEGGTSNWSGAGPSSKGVTPPLAQRSRIYVIYVLSGIPGVGRHGDRKDLTIRSLWPDTPLLADLSPVPIHTLQRELWKGEGIRNQRTNWVSKPPNHFHRHIKLFVADSLLGNLDNRPQSRIRDTGSNT